MGKRVTVVKSGNAWGVRVAGQPSKSTQHRTQQAAIRKAIPIAKKTQAELTIQGRDHKFREKNSYGHDPYPPKG